MIFVCFLCGRTIHCKWFRIMWHRNIELKTLLFFYFDHFACAFEIQVHIKNFLFFFVEKVLLLNIFLFLIWFLKQEEEEVKEITSPYILRANIIRLSFYLFCVLCFLCFFPLLCFITVNDCRQLMALFIADVYHFQKLQL